MNTNYEMIAIIIAVIGLTLTVIRLWSVFVKEHTILQQSSEENRKEIEVNRNYAEIEIQKIITERAKIVDDIYKEIASLKKLHDTDIREIRGSIEKAFEKVRADAQKDHAEILKEISDIKLSLNTVIIRFDEHNKREENEKIK